MRNHVRPGGKASSRRTLRNSLRVLLSVIAGLGAMVALTRPVDAAPLVAELAPLSQPTVRVGFDDQAVSELIVTVPGAVSVGDTITISLDDNDTDANCAIAGDHVGFAAQPEQSEPQGTTARFSVDVAPGGACVASEVDDVVTLTATNAGEGPVEFALSGLRYDIGAGAAAGAVRIGLNGGPPTADDGNALISAVITEAQRPLLPPWAPPAEIPEVLIGELRPGALTGTVCVALASPDDATFAGPVTATTSNAGITLGTPVVGSHQITFTVAGTGTGATVVRLAGIKVDTNLALGALIATVGDGSCDGRYDGNLPMGFVGATARIQGADRYGTAVQIAAREFACQDGNGREGLNDRTVVVARGDSFPDALAASFLAGRHGSTVLLTAPGSLPTATRDALRNFGVRSVVLVGGTSAISTYVANSIDALPVYDCAGQPLAGQTVSVTRISGNDRYLTAKAIAETGAPGTLDDNLDGAACGAGVTSAIVASGENFPDALAAGGLAYGGAAPGGCGSGPIPLLLTPKANLSPATAAAITSLGIEQVLLLGGPNAVAPNVQSALEAGGAVNVIRIEGATRQETAVELAKRALAPGHGADWNGGGFLVARPDNFPDALAGASVSGRNRWPLYLAESTTVFGQGNRDAVASSSAVHYWGVLLGGPSALSDMVADEAGTSMALQAR